MKSLPISRALSFGLFAAALLCGAAQAQSTQTPGKEHSKEDFAAHKAELLSRIDQRTAAAATTRACVSAAASRDDLRACREQARASMESMHPKRPAP